MARIIPDTQLLDAFRTDYQTMLAAQMFYGETLGFEEIVTRLQALEIVINNLNCIRRSGLPGCENHHI